MKDFRRAAGESLCSLPGELTHTARRLRRAPEENPGGGKGSSRRDRPGTLLSNTVQRPHGPRDPEELRVPLGGSWARAGHCKGHR